MLEKYLLDFLEMSIHGKAIEVAKLVSRFNHVKSVVEAHGKAIQKIQQENQEDIRKIMANNMDATLSDEVKEENLALAKELTARDKERALRSKERQDRYLKKVAFPIQLKREAINQLSYFIGR